MMFLQHRISRSPGLRMHPLAPYAKATEILFESGARGLHGRANLFGISKAGGEVETPRRQEQTMELTHRNKPPPPSLPGLISHIQTVTEREKAVLARELH